MKTELTLAEARRVPGHFVYGLRDNADVFYVGKTRNTDGRFEGYVRQAKRGPNSHLLRRLRDASDNLRVVILDYMPADLNAAEAAAIHAHADRLVNVHANPYRSHLTSRSAVGVIALRERHTLALCPCCDGPMDDRRMQYCRTCTDKFVRNRGQVKARARELSTIAKSA